MRNASIPLLERKERNAKTRGEGLGKNPSEKKRHIKRGRKKRMPGTLLLKGGEGVVLEKPAGRKFGERSF